MTYEEFEAALQVFLFDEWLRRVGWGKDIVRGFFEHGIPVEYAKLIAETLGPKFPVSIWPKLLHPPKAVLTNGEVKSRVNSQKMHTQHRLAISKGRAKRDKLFKDTIRKAKPGYTQASLAAAVGMQPSLLSMCRSEERAMFLSRAKRIEALTGWPADKSHWPGGIIEDA